MTVPGSVPPPLIRLALHIFSIHANSASCERLFSLFGNIQTKKQNWMTSKMLQMIAEVKMHLRDGHAASWSQKQKSRAKRKFGPQPSGTHNPDHSLPGVMNWHFSRSFRLIFPKTYEHYPSDVILSSSPHSFQTISSAHSVHR